MTVTTLDDATRQLMAATVAARRPHAHHEGHVGRTRHAAAAGVVHPSAAGLFDLVHRLLREEDGAGETGGGRDRLLEVD